MSRGSKGWCCGSSEPGGRPGRMVSAPNLRELEFEQLGLDSGE